MSNDSRRPPSDGGPDDTIVPAGYLLEEKLAAEESARIFDRLDAVRRGRVASRRRFRLAAGLAAATVAAAAMIGLMLTRRTAVPAPEPRRAEATVAPPASAAPAERRGPTSAKREQAPSPAPATPVVTPPSTPHEPELRADAMEPASAAPPPVVAPAPNAAPARVFTFPSESPIEVVRTMRLSVRRTDDPRRSGISLTIVYRRPSEGGSGEVSR